MKFLKNIFIKEINLKEFEIRDTIYKKDFFDNKINHITYDLDFIRNQKKNNSLGNNINLYEILYKLIISKYSRGDDFIEIDKLSEELLKCAANIWMNTIDYSTGGNILYSKLLDVISIAILFKVDKNYFETLARVIKDRNFNDFIIHSLIQTQIPSFHVSDKLLIDNEPYRYLKEILSSDEAEVDSEENIQKINFYLNYLFYSKQRLGYYYDIHLRNEGIGYYGYWAWEIAAITIIKKIDSCIIKENIYYPKDAFDNYNIIDRDFLI